MTSIKTLGGHTGFLLDKLILKHNKIFGDHFELDFFDKADFEDKTIFAQFPYSTLIIGANGTGKSLVLKIISDILLDLHAQRQAFLSDNIFPPRTNNDYYRLSFYIGKEFYEIQNYNVQTNFSSKRRSFDLVFLRDSKVINIDELLLPERLLVSSLLLTDRFTIHKSPPDFYKYLGVRSLASPSTARTRNYVKRTVEHVVNSFADLDTQIVDKIKRLLSFLNFKETFTIYYFPKYKDKFYTGELSNIKFVKLFENFNDKTLGFSKRETSEYIPFGVSYYKSQIAGNSVLINEIVDFLNEIKKSESLKKDEGSRSEYFEYDVLRSELSLEKYKLLTHLSALDLITFPSIGLLKNKEYVDLENASSGEYHFLSTMIGIYASLVPNSIILIDEPEISLHPNWQMKYMSFLKEIFKEYMNCHFIITTHSHFFASDLDGNSSTIIGLISNETGIEKVDLIKSNTYGWSAEDVLYNIFRVKTVRNYFLEADLTDLLGLISEKSKNRKRIEGLLSKIKAIEISPNDPMNAVIEETNAYLKTL